MKSARLASLLPRYELSEAIDEKELLSEAGSREPPSLMMLLPPSDWSTMFTALSATLLTVSTMDWELGRRRNCLKALVLVLRCSFLWNLFRLEWSFHVLPDLIRACWSLKTRLVNFNECFLNAGWSGLAYLRSSRLKWLLKDCEVARSEWLVGSAASWCLAERDLSLR